MLPVVPAMFASLLDIGIGALRLVEYWPPIPTVTGDVLAVEPYNPKSIDTPGWEEPEANDKYTSYLVRDPPPVTVTFPA